MNVKTGYHALTLLLCLGLAACATSRSEIELSSPFATQPEPAVSSGRTVVIRSVKDERVFEQNPGNPATPSLGFEGVAAATAETRARAIGRKRNGFGKALGDVMLAHGQTVEDVIRENLAAGFEQAGYRVENENEAGSSPLMVDVRIKEFWAWFQPGFWAITLNANIVTDLAVEGAVSTTVLDVHAQESRQFATDSAWMEIVGKALQEYRAQLAGTAEALDQSHPVAAAP